MTELETGSAENNGKLAVIDGERYIQVGVTALRDEKGDFLPAVPLFIRADDSAIAGEEALIKDMAKLLAHRMKAYFDECRGKGIPT